MKTEQEWNDAIILKTSEIQDNYPELSKFISEMPITIPDDNDPHITIKILSDYYYSLDSLVKKYNQNTSL